MGDNYGTVLGVERLATIHTLTPPAGTSFGRDERCHVSFSSNSIIFSLCFYYAFIMLSLCFHYAFIMLSLCFHYAFLGTRLKKVSFFGEDTYLRTIFQIRGFLCLPDRERATFANVKKRSLGGGARWLFTSTSK